MTFPSPEFFRTANLTVSEIEALLARIIIAVAGLKFIYESVFPSKKKGPPS
jgi:hypothetical protein